VHYIPSDKINASVRIRIRRILKIRIRIRRMRMFTSFVTHITNGVSVFVQLVKDTCVLNVVSSSPQSNTYRGTSASATVKRVRMQ